MASKDFLWFFYLFVVARLAPFLSRRVLYGLARAVDPLIQFQLRRQRGPAEARMLGRVSSPSAVFERFVSNSVIRGVDDLILSRPSRDSELICAGVEGIEHLERARLRGRGVLLFSGHFYACRVARRYLANIGYPMLSVRHGAPPDSRAGWLGRHWLQPLYVEFLHRIIRDEVYIQDPECTLKILQRLRSDGLVNMHFDAAFASKTVAMPFLGGKYPFAVGYLDLIRLSGCAVIPMLTLGRGDGFRIRFDPPLELMQERTRDAFVAANLSTLIGVLEGQIVTNPEEWELWMRL